MYWWLSFADNEKPEGEQFLGAVVVDDNGGDFVGAIDNAHRLGLNPGGEALGMPTPEEPKPEWINRFMKTKEDVEAFDAAHGGEGGAGNPLDYLEGSD
jgi:hypothetical protein